MSPNGAFFSRNTFQTVSSIVTVNVMPPNCAFCSRKSFYGLMDVSPLSVLTSVCQRQLNSLYLPHRLALIHALFALTGVHEICWVMSNEELRRTESCSLDTVLSKTDQLIRGDAKVRCWASLKRIELNHWLAPWLRNSRKWGLYGYSEKGKGIVKDFIST